MGVSLPIKVEIPSLYVHVEDKLVEAEGSNVLRAVKKNEGALPGSILAQDNSASL